MKKALIIIAGLSAISLAAYLYIKKQIGLLEQLTLNIIGFQLISFTLSRVSFNLKLRAANKSSIEGAVTDLNIAIYLDSKLIGHVTETKKIIIPSKGSSDVVVLISFSPEDIIGNALDILIGIGRNKDAILSLRGSARVTSSFISTKVPISYDTGLAQYINKI